MKLVIEIPDEVYSHAKDIENRLLTPNEESVLRDSVVNGIPLPKGNMRLINANELLNNLSNTAVYDDDYCYSIVYHAINDAATIIECKGDN